MDAGKSRDIAASRIGLSGKTGQKGAEGVSAIEILEALVISNEQRERTNEQRIREFGVLRMIEEERAKQRQVAAGGDRGNQHTGGKVALQENFPEAAGQSRDLAANRKGKAS
jgi:hypothetical protein